MKYIHLLFIAIFSVFLFLTGCVDNPAEPEHQKEIVVFGYLYGNEALTEEHAIMVHDTQPVSDYYEQTNAAIRNANVTITESESGDITLLVESESKPGYYYNENLIIVPGKTYKLDINTGDQQVSAATTVPAELGIETELSNTEVNNEIQTDLGLRKPVFLTHTNPEQIVLVEMFCDETWENAEYIYPFDESHKNPDDQQEYDQGRNGEPRRIWAMVKIKDMETAEYDNQPAVYWYNSMIVFYGSNTMLVAAIDDNIQNYNTREHPELSGGVVGGIGLFGSLCGTSYNLQINKP